LPKTIQADPAIDPLAAPQVQTPKSWLRLFLLVFFLFFLIFLQLPAASWRKKTPTRAEIGWILPQFCV